MNTDTTSFHINGEYEIDSDFKGMRIIIGYSRDHRPELNQVILNLITGNQAGIPVYMKACSGNTNDSETFKKLVKSPIKSLKAAQRCRYLIGDFGLYVAKTIKALQEQEQFSYYTSCPKHVGAKTVLSNLDGLAWSDLTMDIEVHGLTLVMQMFLKNGWSLTVNMRQNGNSLTLISE